MQELYQQKMVIGPSLCDSTGRLSYPDTFAQFMDIASIHAELLGVGLGAMLKQSKFWLTVKTRVQFFSRPKLGDVVTVRTWPETPEEFRCCRSYDIQKNGETIIAGKTEWAILDMKTGKVTPVDGVYAPDMVFHPSSLPEPFSRIPNQFENGEHYADYTVRSVDIDVGAHMNNIAYIRALMGSFSLAALKEMQLKDMEVIFRSSCYEGDTLRLEKQACEGGLDVGMSKDGETVFLARIL